MTRALAAVLPFFFNIPLLAQSTVSVSTGAETPQPAQTGESPLTFNISKDAHDSRVGLDYSMRWDFSDLSGLRPGVKTLIALFKSAASWDITENTRLKYYGFKTNPWRVFIAREKVAGRAAPSGTLGSGTAAGQQAGYKKRLRLSLSPLVDDFERDFDENLRSALLDSSLMGVSPQWAKVSEKDKKMFFRDVLSIGVWDAPLPLVGKGKESLEYISR